MSWCNKHIKGQVLSASNVTINAEEEYPESFEYRDRLYVPSTLETDRLFIQEVINDLVKRHGMRQGDKALDLLIDWSRELRNKSGLKGRTRREFFKRVGKYLW